MEDHDCFADDDYDPREFFGLAPDASEGEVWECEKAYAEDWHAEIELEDQRIARNHAQARQWVLRRLRSPALTRPKPRARAVRRNRRSVTSRPLATATSRGDPSPSEPSPPNLTGFGPASRRASGDA